MNVERGAAINGRCYAHAGAWAYIDAMVLRDTYTNGAIQPAQRIYYQHDANFNTTAIVGPVGSTWQVTQRYIYDHYGNVTVLNADWSTASSQIPLTEYLHQGGRQDPITGLYLFRHRDYSPTLGNWVEQDPAGYINGASRYQFVSSAPASWDDHTGLVKSDIRFINHIADKYNLSKEGRRELHDRISKERMSPQEIEDEAKNIATEGRKYVNKKPQADQNEGSGGNSSFSFCVSAKTGERVLVVGGVVVATGWAAWLIAGAAVAATPVGL